MKMAALIAQFITWPESKTRQKRGEWIWNGVRKSRPDWTPCALPK